jgi:23S rRNA (adenine2503-C2)-methyltransferase
MNQPTPKPDIQDVPRDQLVAWMADHNMRRFRADQVLKWIYIHQADSFDQMTDLKKPVRDLLSAHFSINRLEKIKVETSVDGSQKYLFRLRDGQAIESVLIPEKNRATLCISSQVGCAQGCRFCLTAGIGFIRNLSAGEITSQVRDIRKDMDDPDHLKNIVFMGMGEPLANYDNVIRAVATITDGDRGFKISTRRVTISTAGLVPRLPDLGRDTIANLAISLNAVDNKTRSMLMPINKTFPIEKLLAACQRYPLSHRRKITIEYILIDGVNDSLDHARRLAALLRPIKAKINLIPFNEHGGSTFRRPPEAVINAFYQHLMDNGYTTIIRRSKGEDISAACGQLYAGVGTNGSG